MNNDKAIVKLCIKILLFGGGGYTGGFSASGECLYAAYREDESSYCKFQCSV